jgi:glycosyltransferase involved in cell wall biosynthesis
VWSIAADPLFDAEWYRWLHPDAPRSRLGAARHFLQQGVTSAPSAEFDSGAYLRANPDVERTGLNPLEHYHRYGRREGRAVSTARRRLFIDASGATDRAALGAFLSSDALRADRLRALPHLRAMLPRHQTLFALLLELLVAPSPGLERRARALALRTVRVTPARASIVIDAAGAEPSAVLATWCSLAADPQVDPALIVVEDSVPATPGTTVRVAAGALVLPGSVAALVAAAELTGRPVFGDIVGPDGTREERWRRPAALADRESILRAGVDTASGTSLLVPAAVSVVWDALGSLDPLPRALVVDQRLPQLDRDSGSMSAVSFMESLLALGYRVTFVPVHLEFDPKHSFVLESLGIEVVDQRDVEAPEEVVALGSFDVALLLKPETVARFGPLLRASSPRTAIISVPMDAHFVRLQGAAELSGRASDRAEAARYRELELANLELVDLTLTGSSDEVRLLRELSPAWVEHLPPSRPELSVDPVPFAQRLDLVFLGGFEHPPNLDGILWFLDEVWPVVAEAVPEARLVVYGSWLPDSLRERADDRVIMHGYIERLEDAFQTARIFIAPLRFGAGYKGKIVSAMSAGVPVVTTSVGASGMELRSVVVADGAAAFAAAIEGLWGDEHRIRELSSRTLAEARRRFTPAAQRKVLGRLLTRLRARDGALEANSGRAALPRT